MALIGPGERKLTEEDEGKMEMPSCVLEWTDMAVEWERLVRSNFERIPQNGLTSASQDKKIQPRAIYPGPL